MALVRKCDLCSTIEGVENFTVRWGGGSGQADLCPEHGKQIIGCLLYTSPSPRD